MTQNLIQSHLWTLKGFWTSKATTTTTEMTQIRHLTAMGQQVALLMVFYNLKMLKLVLADP